MAYLTQFGTATTSNTNLNTTTLVGTFTNTTRIRKLYLNIFADQVKGGGDYKASITVQRAGAGVFYQSIITTNAAAAGVTSILFNSIAVTLNATDVMKVYLLGLSTDNDTTADVIVDVNEEWINVDASGNVAISTGSGAGQLSVTSGVISANVTQIDGAATNGYNATLKLKQLDIQSGSGNLNAVNFVGSGGGAGMSVVGGITGMGAYVSSGANDGYGMIINSNSIDPALAIWGGGTGLEIAGGPLAPGPGIDISAADGDGIIAISGGAGHYAINADIHGTIDTATDVTNTVSANLVSILGTLLTETAGQIAAAFKKFFDKAAPTGTINSLPDALPSAANGLPLKSDLTSATTVNAISDQVWDEAIAGHLTAGSTGAALNTAGAAADPLTNPVPGTYAAGSAGAAIGSLQTGKITVVSPMAQDGLAVKLVRGDDYLNADGRALVWTDSGSNWPNLTGATVRFKWGIFTKSCTVIGAGGAHQQVSLDLTSAETTVLENGTFDLEATLSNTHVVTLVIAGSLIIKDDV